MVEPRRRGVILGLWLGILVAATLVIITRLETSYDLGLFLPAARTPDQQLLLERLGDSPGSRYVMVAVDDAASGPDLDELRDRLAEDPLFDRVLTDSNLGDTRAIPEPLWRYRYLLQDVDLSAQALGTALRQRLGEIGVLGGGRFRDILRADPVLASLQLLQAGNNAADSWRTDDGRRILLAETRAPAFRLDEQARALTRLEEAVAVYPDEAVEISGVGVFGIQLRDTIQREAQMRTILASAALALVLLVAYRRPEPLWLAALPLLTAALLGLACTALIFGRVHGITLAFGMTLLGIAIDYPLHVLSHARHQGTATALDGLWPTLRLGAASTMLAYLAVALSGSTGLAQLGLFTLCGIAAAAACTRWVLPALYAGARQPARIAGSPQAPRLRFWHLPLISGVALIAALPLWEGKLWNSDLSALSPVPEQRLIRDGELRQALGAPDLRYLISRRGSDLSSLLVATESLSEGLAEAIGAGWIDGFQSATALLPSPQAQRRRQAALPGESDLRRALAQATRGTPLSPAAFEPFLVAVRESRSLPTLRREDYQSSPLDGLLEQQLFQSGDEWVSLVALFNPRDPQALARWLTDNTRDAHLVDLQAASRDLVDGYRLRTLRLLGLALLSIAALLLWRTSPRRAAWSLAAVLSGTVATAALLFAIGGPLNLYHLIGLLLVAGLGLDYALFLSQTAPAAHRRDSRHAVWACAASTAGAFAVLALSDIPALGALGSTVAIGTALNMLAARGGTPTGSESAGT